MAEDPTGSGWSGAPSAQQAAAGDDEGAPKGDDDTAEGTDAPARKSTRKKSLLQAIRPSSVWRLWSVKRDDRQDHLGKAEL